jgi:hypothetical protein
MKSVSLFAIPVCLLATMFAMAEGPGSARVSGSLRTSNLELIRELVAGAIRLATDEDPLSRANSCGTLAEHTVKEIRAAVKDRHMDRAVQLSDHLHALLSSGIANNLRTVRLESSQSSTREIDVQRVAAQVRDVLAPLDELVNDQTENAGELRQALRKVRDAQSEVERILTSSTRP